MQIYFFFEKFHKWDRNVFEMPTNGVQRKKLAKLTVYLSLEFPLVPEPAVQLMLMLTECNHFFCVSARLGCVKYSLERAFCTVSFPFIFLAFQALSPLWPIYPLNYMIFLLFISSLYWSVRASCQQSDKTSNELIMTTMQCIYTILYSWNAYVAGNYVWNLEQHSSSNLPFSTLLINLIISGVWALFYSQRWLSLNFQLLLLVILWIWKECSTVDTTQWQKPTFQTHSANTTWIIFEELIQVKASQNNETFLKHTSGFSKSTQQSWCRAKRFIYVLERKFFFFKSIFF